MSYYARPGHAPMRPLRAREIARAIERGDEWPFDDVRQAYCILCQSDDGLVEGIKGLERDRAAARVLYGYLEAHNQV